MGREGAAAARELKREMKLQLMVLGGTLAVLWLVAIVDLVAFGGRLRALGIRPRTLSGLPGILLHPFLHVGLGHLVANSVGLVIAGWLVLDRRKRDYFIVWGLATLVGGTLTWLLGRGVIHVGASGVVFGLIGCLVSRGLFERRMRAIVGSLLLALIFAGTLWAGFMPDDQSISWEGHLFGFVGGVLAARLTGRRTRTAGKPS